MESHAISQVFHRPVSLVDRGYSLTSDMGMVTLKSRGALSDLSVALGQTHKANAGSGGIARLSLAIKAMCTIAVKLKLDCSRVQTHKGGDEVSIDNRSLILFCAELLISRHGVHAQTQQLPHVP